jgi:hypothetical protein
MLTSEHRQAAIGLWILGGLNAFTALPVVLGRGPAAEVPQARTFAAIALVVGIAFIVLGFGTRLGNRTAMLGAVVMLALFGIYQLYGLFATGSFRGLIPLLITGLILSLVVRVLRS